MFSWNSRLLKVQEHDKKQNFDDGEIDIGVLSQRLI